MKSIVKFLAIIFPILLLGSCGPSDSPTNDLGYISEESATITGLSEVTFKINSPEAVDFEFFLWSIEDPDQPDASGYQPVSYEVSDGFLTVFAGDVDGSHYVDVMVANESGSKNDYVRVHYSPNPNGSPVIDEVQGVLSSDALNQVQVEYNPLYHGYMDLAYLAKNSHIPLDDAFEASKLDQGQLIADMTASKVLLADGIQKVKKAELRIKDLIELKALLINDLNVIYDSTIEKTNNIRNTYLLDIAPMIPDLNVVIEKGSLSLIEGNESIGAYNGNQWVFQSTYEFMADL